MNNLNSHNRLVVGSEPEEIINKCDHTQEVYTHKTEVFGSSPE